MALARMVAHSNVRRLIVVLSIVSALAFMLGQGVAAYQTNFVGRPVAALQHMANQVRAQVTEQIAIARGVTPTPTVRVPGNRPAAHSSSTHRPVSTTAALIVPQQPASDTQQASDAQNGKHGDANGDVHQHDKQKGDQQGDHQQSDQQKTKDASGQSGQGGDNTGGNHGSNTASGQGGDQQKPDKHNGGGDPTTTDTSSQK